MRRPRPAIWGPRRGDFTPQPQVLLRITGDSARALRELIRLQDKIQRLMILPRPPTVTRADVPGLPILDHVYSGPAYPLIDRDPRRLEPREQIRGAFAVVDRVDGDLVLDSGEGKRWLVLDAHAVTKMRAYREAS